MAYKDLCNVIPIFFLFHGEPGNHVLKTQSHKMEGASQPQKHLFSSMLLY